MCYILITLEIPNCFQGFLLMSFLLQSNFRIRKCSQITWREGFSKGWKVQKFPYEPRNQNPDMTFRCLIGILDPYFMVWHEIIPTSLGSISSHVYPKQPGFVFIAHIVIQPKLRQRLFLHFLHFTQRRPMGRCRFSSSVPAFRWTKEQAPLGKNSKKIPTDPRNIPQIVQIWKDSLHKQVDKGPGYVPGVCWNFLRKIQCLRGKNSRVISSENHFQFETCHDSPVPHGDATGSWKRLLCALKKSWKKWSGIGPLKMELWAPTYN